MGITSNNMFTISEKLEHQITFVLVNYPKHYICIIILTTKAESFLSKTERVQLFIITISTYIYKRYNLICSVYRLHRLSMWKNFHPCCLTGTIYLL